MISGGGVISGEGVISGGREGSTDGLTSGGADGASEAGGHSTAPGASELPGEPPGLGSSIDGITPLASGVGNGMQLGDGLGLAQPSPPSSGPHDFPNGWNRPS